MYSPKCTNKGVNPALTQAKPIPTITNVPLVSESCSRTGETPLAGRVERLKSASYSIVINPLSSCVISPLSNVMIRSHILSSSSSLWLTKITPAPRFLM